MEEIKDYLISKVKWLLNLNESCLPESRRNIHFGIFDLIFALPSVLSGNDFLQEVLEDLLVERIPATLFHLGLLMEFFKGEGSASKEEKLAERLMQVSKG